MANNWGTQSLVAKEILYQFSQVGKVARNVDFRTEEFKPDNNAGQSRTFRRPTINDVTQTTPAAVGGVAGAPTYSDLAEPSVALPIEQKFISNFQIGIDDLAMSLTREQAIERHIKPTVARMARMIDRYIASKAIRYAGQVLGNPAAPATGDTLLTNLAGAQALFNARGREDDGDSVIITPESVATVLQQANLKLFNPGNQIADMYKKGLMGQYANFDFYRSPLLPSDNVSVVPTVAGTVNGASQGLTTWAQTWSLAVTGITIAGNVVKAGTKVKLAGINWCNPDTKDDTGVQAVFSVVQDATLTGGAGTLVLSEPCIISGPHQNVYAGPANGAALTWVSVVSGSQPSLAFSRKAIIAASPRLNLPKKIEFSEQDEINGINIAIIESFDPYNFNKIFSIQALIGAAAYLPEHIATIY